jgi:hypothetical protein
MSIKSIKSGYRGISALAGNVPFSPADLSGLKLWLDAADTSTISLNGSGVSQWNDKSTNAKNFAQATAGAQPTSGVTTQNGKNVITFDGGDTLTNTDRAYFKFIHDGSTCFVSAVVKLGNSSDPNALYTIMANNGLSSSTIGHAFYMEDRASVPANERIVFWVTTSSSGTQPVFNESADGELDPNNFEVVSNLIDANDATAANRSELRVDNGAAIKNNVQTGAPSSSNAGLDLAIGSSGNSTFYLTGAVAEIVIVEGADATAANILKVKEYFQKKWGI